MPVTKRKEGKPPKVPHAALRMNVVAETKIFGNGPSMQTADAVQPLPAFRLPVHRSTRPGTQRGMSEPPAPGLLLSEF